MRMQSVEKSRMEHVTFSVVVGVDGREIVDLCGCCLDGGDVYLVFVLMERGEVVVLKADLKVGEIKSDVQRSVVKGFNEIWGIGIAKGCKFVVYGSSWSGKIQEGLRIYGFEESFPYIEGSEKSRIDAVYEGVKNGRLAISYDQTVGITIDDENNLILWDLEKGEIQKMWTFDDLKVCLGDEKNVYLASVPDIMKICEEIKVCKDVEIGFSFERLSILERRNKHAMVSLVDGKVDLTRVRIIDEMPRMNKLKRMMIYAKNLTVSPISYLTDTLLWHFDSTNETKFGYLVVPEYKLIRFSQTTPMQLLMNKLEEKKYDEAKELCEEYGISLDFVYKQIWEDCFEMEALKQIKDDEWVVGRVEDMKWIVRVEKESVKRILNELFDFVVMKNAELSEEIGEWKRRLDIFDELIGIGTFISWEEFVEFREREMNEIAKAFAVKCQFEALYLVYDKFREIDLRVVLKCVPETVKPSSYAFLLKNVVDEGWIKERMYEIEECCGMIEYAVEFVRICKIEIEMDKIERFYKFSSKSKVSLREAMGKSEMEWVEMIVMSSNRERIISDLREYCLGVVTEENLIKGIEILDIEMICEIVEHSKPGVKNRIIVDEDELIDLVLKSCYFKENCGGIEIYNRMYESLPMKRSIKGELKENDDRVELEKVKGNDERVNTLEKVKRNDERVDEFEKDLNILEIVNKYIPTLNLKQLKEIKNPSEILIEKMKENFNEIEIRIFVLDLKELENFGIEINFDKLLFITLENSKLFKVKKEIVIKVANKFYDSKEYKKSIECLSIVKQDEEIEEFYNLIEATIILEKFISNLNPIEFKENKNKFRLIKNLIKRDSKFFLYPEKIINLTRKLNLFNKNILKYILEKSLIENELEISFLVLDLFKKEKFELDLNFVELFLKFYERENDLNRKNQILSLIYKSEFSFFALTKVKVEVKEEVEVEVEVEVEEGKDVEGYGCNGSGRVDEYFNQKRLLYSTLFNVGKTISTFTNDSPFNDSPFKDGTNNYCLIKLFAERLKSSENVLDFDKIKIDWINENKDLINKINLEKNKNELKNKISNLLPSKDSIDLFLNDSEFQLKVLNEMISNQNFTLVENAFKLIKILNLDFNFHSFIVSCFDLNLIDLLKRIEKFHSIFTSNFDSLFSIHSKINSINLQSKYYFNLLAESTTDDFISNQSLKRSDLIDSLLLLIQQPLDNLTLLINSNYSSYPDISHILSPFINRSNISTWIPLIFKIIQLRDFTKRNENLKIDLDHQPLKLFLSILEKWEFNLNENELNLFFSLNPNQNDLNEISNLLSVIQYIERRNILPTKDLSFFDSLLDLSSNFKNYLTWDLIELPTFNLDSDVLDSDDNPWKSFLFFYHKKQLSFSPLFINNLANSLVFDNSLEFDFLAILTADLVLSRKLELASFVAHKALKLPPSLNISVLALDSISNVLHLALNHFELIDDKDSDKVDEGSNMGFPLYQNVDRFILLDIKYKLKVDCIAKFKEAIQVMTDLYN
ncbi:hypothetical protein O9G_005646 [Rozella allomycis CSF55]|uniref:Uncharacterized protein n=1 Tax=Rozella allomycis (strain CSF55) TaxID=988480 RepID=A0A075ASH0_ROZAC|nr:hypothetical protein O9G_005646 [Rozella allomycis CSF55]|eukprot:EPZ33231.1 hypothetical protein O9G_005646 [Rozella allomycis CSF55]